MSDAEINKMVEVGELSRDYGLDITVSNGGMVTSALNQRQYRAECGKLYQQFMLSMADYIFEEAQLKKRLQGLLLHKKQPRIGSSLKRTDDTAPGGAGWPHGDEDAFTPAQMEEFRRLANSRASNRSVSRAGIVTETDMVRPPTTASIRAPSRTAGARADTPHIFPALRERPLATGSTSKVPRVGSAATIANKRPSLASGAMLYGGRDQEYDGVMDPTADFSNTRRMRMNPRAFCRLTSAGQIKVKVMDKKGEFVMKPVIGKPGVVSVNGSQDKEEGGEQHPVIDSKDKMALVKTTTSFKTPTLSSELKTNNLVAIQRSLRGKEAKRMTVGDVMAKSRDRRARLFRVQMSTGRMDDWDVPGEERVRPPTRSSSAGGRSLERGGPSRLGMSPAKGVVDVNVHLRTSPPSEMRKEETPIVRAKTAPASRHKVRSSSIPTPRPDPMVDANDGTRGGQTARSPSMNPRPWPPSRAPASQTKVSVVQLELDGSVKGHRHQPQPPHTPVQRSPSKSARAAIRRQMSSSSSRAVFPVSAKSLASDSKTRPVSVRFGKEDSRKPESKDTADKECTVQIRHINTLRDSAAVVRRWKELDQDREDKLNKWRMRMSFAATRRGNLGKMLSKV